MSSRIQCGSYLMIVDSLNVLILVSIMQNMPDRSDQMTRQHVWQWSEFGVALIHYVLFVRHKSGFFAAKCEVALKICQKQNVIIYSRVFRKHCQT